MERKLPNSKRRETRRLALHATDRAEEINRDESWLIARKHGLGSWKTTRGKIQLAYFDPGLSRTISNGNKFPMVKGNDRWSVVSRWFVSRFQRFFMVKLWREIYRSECICKRICKLVCYGSRRSYFLFFIFFFVAPINWCYCISFASYDVDI